MIDRDARIGDWVVIGVRSQVWQFASVIRGAIIGSDCSIGGCAIVDAATIGDRCLIGHGAQIHPGVYLGDGVFVGPGAILCNDRWPSVDKNGFESGPLLDGKMITIRVGDGASIGAGAIILPGVSIGVGTMIAAGAVVDEDVGSCRLYKRNGEIVPIDPARPCRRMRAAA